MAKVLTEADAGGYGSREGRWNARLRGEERREFKDRRAEFVSEGKQRYGFAIWQLVLWGVVKALLMELFKRMWNERLVSNGVGAFDGQAVPNEE